MLLEHSAILSTFIRLPFVIKIFVLSIFEWLFYTDGFTVVCLTQIYQVAPECRLITKIFSNVLESLWNHFVFMHVS